MVLVSWGISFPILYGLHKHNKSLREEDRRTREFYADLPAFYKREADKLADAKREADKLADAEANKVYKRIIAEHQAKAKRKNKGK